MNIEKFDFNLPDERIALRPAVPRDHSRLLVVRPGFALEDRRFHDLADFLRPGDGLVFNDTRVIPAQFDAVRHRQGNIARLAITLHRRISPNQWAAFAKGAKKVKIGERLSLAGEGANSISAGQLCFAGNLQAQVSHKGDNGEIELTFDLCGPVLDEAMMANGQMPLPPYIASKRPQDDRDLVDYQTIYAANEGAVAAPTAGLHFSEEVFAKLANIGVTKHFVTLHVGAGTFLPVKTQDTNDHRMHFENGIISAQTALELNSIRARGRRIVSVGTTSLRLLESAVDGSGKFSEWNGATDIFITPGYKFQAIDLLMTNFHLPRSTLFMLVSAFCGLEFMQKAYAHAIRQNYRFFSYGDASLLYPAKDAG